MRAPRDPGSGLSLRGRWLAIIAGSAVLQFSYWPIVAGVAAAPDGGVGLIALGLALVPFVFLVLAIASRNRNTPGAVLRAMGWFLVVGIPLGLLLPVAGVAVGFGLGGVVTLAPLVDVDTRRTRYLAVVGMLVYLVVLWLVVPPFALASAAVLPFGILGIVDQTVEERARFRAADDGADLDP